MLDEGSFVEIGGAVTARSTDFNLQEKETPADGVITGYGVIDGNLVYVYSQDAAVLNGAIGEMHAKKIANIYDMAVSYTHLDVYKRQGLVRCPGIGAVVTPQGFLFPKYSGEMRREGEQTIVVSRGLGSHTINIRLFNMRCV